MFLLAFFLEIICFLFDDKAIFIVLVFYLNNLFFNCDEAIMSISIDAHDDFCSYLLTQNYNTIRP